MDLIQIKKTMTDDEYAAQMEQHDTAVARMTQQRVDEKQQAMMQRQQDSNPRPKSGQKRSNNNQKQKQQGKDGKSGSDKSHQQQDVNKSGFALFTPPADEEADGYYELDLINSNYDVQLNEQLQQVVASLDDSGGSKDGPKESDVVLLDLLNRQIPKSLAFDTLKYRNNKTVETSLNERLMEFELERMLWEKGDLVKQRMETLTKPFDSNAPGTAPFISAQQPLGFDPDDLRGIDLSGTPLGEAPELLLHRKVRERALDEELTIPQVKLPVSEADLIDQEIRLAGEALNTKSFAVRTITRFYESQARSTKLHKFKTLQRYARFANTCTSLDRSEQILSERLTKIDKRYEIAKNRLVDLRLAAQAPQSREAAQQMKPLQERDFDHFTRHHVYNMAMKKHIDHFSSKMKWISYSERFNLFKKAFETQQISKQNSDIPRLTVSAEEIELQFQDLKNCFDLERILRVDEYGQEFLYRVSKNFNVVFAAQCKNMKLWPYPGTDSVDARQANGQAQNGEEKKKEAVSPKYVYIKPMAFEPYDYFSQNVSDEQKRQHVVLREKVSMDTQLRSEAAFLGTFDATYASRRLQNQAETHFSRAYIKHIVATEDDENPFQPIIEGGKQTVNQLSAVYMLRFNRIREFRKKVFDILNFFRSILRRLALDKNGYGVAQIQRGIPSVIEDNSVTGTGRMFRTQKLLTEPGDLQPVDGEPVSSSKASRQTCYRDDTYELTNGRELAVRDSNGLLIVYQEAIRDLEQLEQELVNIGSYFIYKNTDKPLSKTLTSKFDVVKGVFYGGRGDDSSSTDGEQRPSSSQQNIPATDIEIDRFMVLEDLYESEAWFQDGKRKVIECYLEAYEHCVDVAAQDELAQIIVDLIRKRPILDLENSKYFTENYASEIMASELTYSLLKDIVQHQIVLEQDYTKYVHRIKAMPTSASVSFSQQASFLAAEESFGHPLELLDDANVKMNLLPGSTRVSFSDFFVSLSNVISVYHAIDSAVADIKKSFGIKDPAIVSALHRTILQQAIVEWKLLVEEERVQRTANLRISAERRALENRILMEDAAEVYEIAREAAEQLNSGGKIQHDASSSSSNAPDAVTNPLQVYCNIIELLLMWKNLNDQVFETDIVCSIHSKQCQVVQAGGVDNDREHRKNGQSADKFLAFQPILADVPVQDQDGNVRDLAINVEFGREMADAASFQSRSGFRRAALESDTLSELRTALQYQVAQRSMIATLVRYNQVLLDNYLLCNKLKKNVLDVFSLTSVPMDNNPFFQAPVYDSPSLDRMLLDMLFSYPSVFKSEMYAKMSDEFVKIQANVMRTRTGVQARSRLREMRFQLVRDYIAAANIFTATHAFKLQIIQTSTEIRSVLQLIPVRGMQPDERGFVIGQDTDELQATARSFSLSKGASNATSKDGKDQANTATESQKASKPSATARIGVGQSALAKDGLVANPFYVPHFIQVMRTEFGSSESTSSSSRSQNRVKSMQILRAYLEIMQVDSAILLLLWSRFQMALPASEVVLNPQRAVDEIPQFIKHIFTEILYISNPEDPFSVRDYLLQKANTLYMRILVSVLRLNETICNEHKDTDSSKIIRRAFDELFWNWGSAINPVYSSPLVVDDISMMLRRGVDAELQGIVDRFDQGTLLERSSFLQPLSPCFQQFYWPIVPSLFVAPEKKFKDFRQLVENVISVRFRDKQPFALLQTFLFDLQSGHRNLFHGIDHSIDELFDDVLAEYKKYSATDSEEAGKLIFEVVRTQLQTLLLKNRYLKAVERYVPPNIATNPKRMDAFYLMAVVKRSKKRYEKELLDHNLRVEAAIKARSEQETAQAFDTGVILEITKPLNAHSRIKLSKEQYEKELLVLKQEINKLLILEQIRRSKTQLSRMRDEVRRPSTSSGSNRDLQALKATKEDTMFTGDGKLLIFQSFLQSLAKHGVKTKTKTGSTAITIHEQDLQQALDVVGTKLKGWKEDQLENMRRAHEAIVDQHRHIIFTLEQKVHYLEYSRDLDKKSFMRRVSSEVVDKNYDLIFLVDTLTRENTKLLQRLIDLKEQAKNEVREEYDTTVQELAKELLALHAKFNDYKRSLYDRLASKFADIKDDTIVKMAERKEGSAALKKQILQVVMEDNEGNRIQRLAEKHETDEIKLATLHRLRLLTLKSKYENTIRSIEQEKEKTTEDFFGDKQQSEIRQNMLRQELIKVQTALSNTEKELSELRDELRLEVKNKERLRIWKNKHNELFQQLQKQIQQYERWSNVDVDKLILEVDRRREQVKNLSQLEQRVSKNAEIVERRTKKQLEMMKTKLQKEQTLKSKAFQKLEEFKTELISTQQTQGVEVPQQLAQLQPLGAGPVGSVTARSTETSTSSAFASMAGHWQKRYYDAVSELNFALQDVEILRDALQRNGVDPNTLLGRTERPMATSQRSISLPRPTSSSSSTKIPSISTTPSLSASTSLRVAPSYVRSRSAGPQSSLAVRRRSTTSTPAISLGQSIGRTVYIP